MSKIEAGKIPYTQRSLEAAADAYLCNPADLLMRNPKDEASFQAQPSSADVEDHQQQSSPPASETLNAARLRRVFFREWREFRHLSKEQLAKRLGITKATVSRIETGHSPYHEGYLIGYADALNCEPADLISRPPDVPQSEVGRQALPVTVVESQPLQTDLLSRVNVGERIKKSREAKGWSGSQLAGKLGITRAAVSYWESGRTNPSMDHLKRVAQLLGVQMNDLIAGEPALTDQVDPVLHTVWKKLDNRKRRTLVQIALIISAEN